jgi:isocitrate/isopropylmalate dehydrogenase
LVRGYFLQNKESVVCYWCSIPSWEFVFEDALKFGATAIDKTGTSLPQQTLNLCLMNAVLFSAVGDQH